MPEKEARGGGRKLVLGVVLIALVTLAAVIGFRRYEARRVRAEEAPVQTSVDVTAPQPPPAATPLTPPAPLSRADILAAVSAAASAHAAGEPGEREPSSLLGRRFRVVQAFGCTGPRDPTTDMAASWAYGPDRRTVRIRVRPEDWTESDFARGLGAEVERVQGFWIPRPWMASEACPPSRNDPFLTELPGSSPQTVGLVRVFEAESSRVSQRGDRPYEVTVPVAEGAAAAAPQGYRLVLEGRVAGLDNEQAIACRSTSPDQRPVCLVGVEIDRLAILDPVEGTVLGEWRS